MARFFASCGKGLEYLLADELLASGCARATATTAGVNAEGDLLDAQRAVLWSRLASRVLWPLVEFDCPDEQALYAGVAAIDWPRHLADGDTLAVDAHVSGDALTHARFAALRVKDAVVDVMRAATGTRPDVDVDAPDLRLNLVVRKGRAILSVDLGGGSLHRRGWRQQQGEAPLKETLAAAVLLRGGWPQVYADGGALLDPMCGSGTLLIEGALMAADVAPGLLRHGGREPSRWRGFDRDDWRALCEQAREREQRGRAALRPVFIGRDIDPQAIRAARDNEVMAGLAGLIDWQVAPVGELSLGHADASNVRERSSRHSRAGGTSEAQIVRRTTRRVSAANYPWTSTDVPDDPANDHPSSTSMDPRARGDAGQQQPGEPARRFPGLAVCNPPYDARLAADPALYRSLGDALAREVPTWRASLLCGDAELAHATGLRAKKKYQLFNGAIECTLIVCDPVASPARAASDAPRELSEGAQMVANRLRRNLRKSKAWRQREGITCWRAYDADLPEYSAAIDVYTTDEAEPQSWLHVQEYAAPADIPEPVQRRRLNELLAAAREVFAVPRERLALKTRERGKGGSKYSSSGHARRDEFLIVREGGARLRVNLFDYLDTGLFLDHRPMRQRIADEADDTRFLNLFGYTGAATVHAAVGGARRTTTVDLSGTYLQWCADNLRENGQGGDHHRLVQADVLEWLRHDTAQYDLVFCDPPTFSNSKRAQDFDIQAAHVPLLQAAVARLAPGGVLYFSNNFRRFRLDEAAVAGFADCNEISAATIPPDFERNRRIHRCWRLTRRS